MNATNIIAANEREHTVHGYPAHHMIASAHATSIRYLCDKLNEYEGIGGTPQAGCHFADMTLGDATVKVEFKYERGEPQTYDHPGCDESLAIIGVLINGKWCDAEDCIPDTVLKRWEEELLEGRYEAAEEHKIAAAEARREWMLMGDAA